MPSLELGVYTCFGCKIKYQILELPKTYHRDTLLHCINCKRSYDLSLTIKETTNGN